jgi:hypothetical protein
MSRDIDLCKCSLTQTCVIVLTLYGSDSEVSALSIVALVLSEAISSRTTTKTEILIFQEVFFFTVMHI